MEQSTNSRDQYKTIILKMERKTRFTHEKEGKVKQRQHYQAAFFKNLIIYMEP